VSKNFCEESDLNKKQIEQCFQQNNSQKNVPLLIIISNRKETIHHIIDIVFNLFEFCEQKISISKSKHHE